MEAAEVSDIDNGGMAFPVLLGGSIGPYNGVTCRHDMTFGYESGMSLRDYFAGQALSGWYTNTGMLPDERNLAGFAKNFYAMADAMLKARND